MRDEIERFVASLAIPDDRKRVVRTELTDHVACAMEAAVREGRDPEAAARAALGDLEAMRRSLEAVEPAFRVTRRNAMARGLIAGVLVAIMIEQAGSILFGLVGAVTALAIGAVLAPPRALDLLRAEMRAPRLRGALGIAGGVPIGPALTYGFTVMSVPFLVWIGLIVERAYHGVLRVQIPWSAFTLVTAVYLMVAVELIRARRDATA